MAVTGTNRARCVPTGTREGRPHGRKGSRLEAASRRPPLGSRGGDVPPTCRPCDGRAGVRRTSCLQAVCHHAPRLFITRRRYMRLLQDLQPSVRSSGLHPHDLHGV